jgi:hypothetical protein
MSDPASWNERRGVDSRETIIAGFLKSSSLAETKALRTELLEQQGTIVAITYSLDDSMDGFYLLSDVSVDTIPTSFRGAGFFPYEFVAYRVGGSGATEFQSLITGTARSNEHGLTAGETSPLHAPARNHVAYAVDAGTPVQDTISTADGNLNRYYDMDFDADPSWSVEPEDYYSAGAYINIDGRLRAGLDAPSNPADFEIGNGIIKIVPSTTATVSDGWLDFSWWTGASYAVNHSLSVYFEATRIPEYMYTAIITNTPQVCRLRLVRDAEDPSSIYRHVLDIEVQRGQAYASFVYTFSSGTGPAYIQIKDESGNADTWTTVTPTGASDHTSYEGVTASGLTVGSSRTLNLTGGVTDGVRIDNYVGAFQRDFFVGYELSASASDTVEDIALQYHGPLSVVERAVRR